VVLRANWIATTSQDDSGQKSSVQFGKTIETLPETDVPRRDVRAAENETAKFNLIKKKLI
jgi:hypothetical protein